MPTLAVIGAGIAGLTCARALSAHGIEVCVFDKGRRPGGRLATRRTGNDTAHRRSYDHGAQYFTARDPRFIPFCTALRDQEVVAPWRPRFAEIANGTITPLPAADTEWLVGVPGMSALAAALAADLRVMTGVHVARIERQGASWTLVATDGARCGRFDAVIVAVPAPQALPLLEATAPRLAVAAAAVRLEPCWALMVALDRRMPVDFDAVTVTGSALAWGARDGAKPGREGRETWVLHAAGDWSAAHLEDAPGDVAAALLSAFGDATNVTISGVAERQAHRWRYARVAEPLGKPFLLDEERGIGACGDWCLSAKMEAAFLSGTAMAEGLLATLAPALRR